MIFDLSFHIFFGILTIALCFEYDDAKANELSRLLYPKLSIQNISALNEQFEIFEETEFIEPLDRRLQVNSSNTSTDDEIFVENGIVCVTCSGLQLCNILNGYMVQEVYYPDNPQFLGTCKVIEQLGERVYSEIFGVGKTFRDTQQCRMIVMQYLCLFWGSNNTMYTNRCKSRDRSDLPVGNKQIHIQTPPCRSFCVQIAEVCANDYSNFLNICWEIACPPTETTCTPDPSIGAQIVSAGIGCAMPYEVDPYSIKNSGYKWSYSSAWILSGAIAVIVPMLVGRF
jgi:hypothetical protein